MKRVNPPSSVYRLQLNKDFTFTDAIAIIPYLRKLGIDAVYCSPIFQASSPHGYDVDDPTRANSLLGGNPEYQRLCRALKKAGLGQILDLVPNHMGIKGVENKWWQSVLEFGEKSPHASFFDIDWDHQLLLPILHTRYAEALEGKQIQLALTHERLEIIFADYRLPINAQGISYLLEQIKWTTAAAQKRAKTLAKKLGKEVIPFFHKHPEVHAFLRRFNGVANKPQSFNRLDHLLSLQHYRLTHWIDAAQEINYRRFFNINELVAIRVEEKKVFQATHKWIFSLVDRGHIQGLRIDHPDGLYDPLSYLKTLRTRTKLYTVVEKILAREELLPEAWPVDGTVGYDYLNDLNGLFVQSKSETAFDRIYQKYTKRTIPYSQLLYEKKRFFAATRMPNDIRSLASKLAAVAHKKRAYRDFTTEDLGTAITELIAHFPVYRSYISSTDTKLTTEDQRNITAAFQAVQSKPPQIDSAIFAFLKRVLLLKEGREYRDFILRFQQLTAPITAKGLEDTTLYLYNRMISLNEVGGDPSYFGCTVEDFHRHNKRRSPYSFLATSTHDTKRSEDVRLRIDVLSEMPKEWETKLRRWSEINKKHRCLDPNTEYFLYQTLVGAYTSSRDFVPRMCDYLIKAAREAKEETSWMFVDPAYEKKLLQFFKQIMKNRTFLTSFRSFHKKVSAYAALSSLSQTVIKLCSPGVVDIYQGTEALHYTLVDPDNRRPVDFKALQKNLEKNLSKTSLYSIGLHDRQKEKKLYLEGEYIPLQVKGAYSDHIVAFARCYKKKVLLCIVTRFFTKLPSPPLGNVWKTTEIILPKKWRNIPFIDLITERRPQTFLAKDLFHTNPFTILKGAHS